MTERRNFRSHYYEKVGFRGVEEKKSLEILLSEDPVDIDKLGTFCARFSVPAMFRPLVWKLILGILPPHPSIHDFVWQQRTEQFNDLHRGLKVMSSINEETPMSLCFLKMFLLEEGRLPLEDEKLPENDEHDLFVTIATASIEMNDEDDLESYWTAVCVFRLGRKMKDQIRIMPSTFKTILKKEDPELYNHLLIINSLEKLPYSSWFNALYAGVLPTDALKRVWDRVLGGASRVLIYVALTQLLTHRKTLMGIGTADLVSQYLHQMPLDNAEVLVNEAIEFWEKDGSHLRPEQSVT
ncbi:TBC1 domain family member 7-like isoform X2 [Lytechinus pictus]|uniref:TBC1 domain family member 7-like isoform X2 n=1 Tax=Lytechinus pictus TaxID=7653 RepID=UPI00240D054A|nr:TBC1 domain family member 7-like [Lytechinus pictus]XP_054757518.1 TBC1 domain family member 7-like [Lytechinus pictus]